MNGMQVLLVEDDVWMAEVTSRSLARWCKGVTVRVASDALAAFDSIDEQLPDVVVLDMLLDGPTGMAFLHELQSHSDTVRIPVVVFSALDGIVLDDLRPYGVVACIDKATAAHNAVALAVREALGVSCR